MIVGGVGNGATEEDWLWDLNPGAAVIPKREPHSFGSKGREDHGALAQWGPHGGDTADGARSSNHGLVLVFLRYGTPDWAEEEGRTVCICGYSIGL